MKKFIIAATALLISAASFAQQADEVQLAANTEKAAAKGKNAKQEKDAAKEARPNKFSNHFKFYGFIRNYFSYDTRESLAGTEDFFYYLPKDVNIVDGVDLNRQDQFRFAALTSRVGVNVSGYEFGGVKMGAKVEADFYAGLSTTDKVTGTATLRLRQAYVTFGKGIWDFKIGQAWHPLAADLPDVISLNSGSPINPFSRTPEVVFNLALPKDFSITAASIWPMQYTSTGPDGASASYIKYGCTPEFYLGLNYIHKNSLFRLGADLLSIKPRHNDGTKKVSDRITTISPFFYYQYVKGDWAVRFKTIYAQAGEHLGLNGGYGVSSIDADGNWTYTPSQNSSTWFSVKYGRQLYGTLFGGYVRNFGTVQPLVSTSGNPELADPNKYWFSKNSYTNLNRLWRITPGIVYNLGKLSFGLEFEITSAQYGEYAKYTEGTKTYNCVNTYGLATDNLHWVTNFRALGMVKFTF